MRLKDSRAIVTGSASGIGRAIALTFAREGATVAVADLDADKARQVVADIERAGGQALALRVDVSDEDSVRAMCQRMISQVGGVDVLVNNANNKPSDDLLQMSTADWDRDVGVTLRGSYLCTRAVLPGMLDQGGGAIVNISSVNALGFYGNEAYSAAKAGVLSLTRSVAVRYGSRGVRANAVAPGTVRTPVWEDRVAIDPEVLDKARAWYPTQRVGEPQDIANAALFLASDEASWVTGIVLPVDGGLTAGSYRMTTDLVPESEL